MAQKLCLKGILTVTEYNYHEDLEKEKGCGVVAHEKHESQVSQ